MKPRTVQVILELRDCTIPLADLKQKFLWSRAVSLSFYNVAKVTQVTVTVAQPSKDKK